MAIDLKRRSALSKLAGHLYDYLPGSGARTTFGSVASKLGVGDFWPGGSKLPAIVELVTATYEHRPDVFCNLITEIVAAGIEYGDRKREPVTQEDIAELCDILIALGFQIPELCDREFMATLQRRPATVTHRGKESDVDHGARVATALHTLRTDFLALSALDNRQLAGQKFETFLTHLFRHFGLETCESFRITGEQIDGAFIMDHQTYLLEAKWHSAPISVAELYAFNTKVVGKSAYTRGLFISINGYVSTASSALRQGKELRIFMIDGCHILPVLEGRANLVALLRAAVHQLTVRGEPYERMTGEWLDLLSGN